MTALAIIRRLLTSDYGATAVKKAIVIFVGLASSALVARFLGPAGRGDYALVANWAAILTVAFNLGISSSYQSARRSEGPEIVTVYVAYSLTLFAILSTLSFLVLIFGHQTAFAIGLLSSITVLRLQLQSYHMIESLQGDARVVLYGHLFNLLCVIAVSLFCPALLVWAIAALVLKESFISVASFRGLSKTYAELMAPTRPKASFAGDLAGSFGRIRTINFSSSLPVFLMTILIVANYKIDVIFLDALHVDATLIGVFSVGVIVAEYLWIVSDIFKDVQISRTSKGSQPEGVAAAMRMAIAATVVVYAAFAICGKPFVMFVFGAEYSDSYNYSLLMLVGNLFMVPCKIIGAYLISTSRTSAYLAAMFAAVFCNVVLNLLLIPEFGVYGAIVASVVSYSLPGLVVIRVFLKMTNFPLRNVLLPQADDLTAIRGMVSRN